MTKDIAETIIFLGAEALPVVAPAEGALASPEDEMGAALSFNSIVHLRMDVASFVAQCAVYKMALSTYD